MPERQPIAIVLKTYPKLSETFILEELLGLERLGFALEIFSLQRPTDDRTNPENELVAAPVHYPKERRIDRLRDLMTVLRRHPVRYVRAARRAADPDQRRVATSLAAVAIRTDIGRFHVHFLNEPTTVTELASAMTGLPFSASAHAKDIYLTNDDELRRKLGAADFVVTCTEHNRDHLAELAPAGATVHRVHHGVELERFEGSAHRQVIPHLLAVGRLRAKKGFDVLVDACVELRRDGIEFTCQIVGYGPEEAALRSQIDAAGLDRHVQLVGKCTRTEVIDHYRRATVLVQPCRVVDDGDRDGIPNVLLEAMAMKLPVIATPVSGIPELVRHGDNGFLVPENDATALAAQIKHVIQQPDQARRIGDAARATVEQHFTAVRSAHEIAELLDPPTVAYVVKGYPRLSELFIATEIYRLERLGLPLRLFVLKQADEPVRHQVVRETRTTPRYLPPMTSISKRSVPSWLRQNLGEYIGPTLRVARRSPVGFATAVRDAAAQSWRARKGRWPRKLYLKEFLQAAAIADGVLAERSIKHLHAHFCHGATTVTWLAATMTRLTFSFTAHAKDIYREDLNPAGLLARKLDAAAFATTCTDANRLHLLGIEPQSTVHTNYHGLNEEFSRLLEEAPPREQSPGRPFRILAVGRLVEKKGLDLLLRATGALVDQGVDLAVQIIGEDGDHADLLRALVAELELERCVEFRGAMDQRQLFEQFRSADAFVLPCRVLADGDRDGIPNVIAEAMAAGLPVVSTAISGIPELVEHRENGLLVAPESVDAIVKAIMELHDDPDLRTRLANAARETIRTDFDGWVTTRELASLFRTQVRGNG